MGCRTRKTFLPQFLSLFRMQKKVVQIPPVQFHIEPSQSPDFVPESAPDLTYINGGTYE